MGCRSRALPAAHSLQRALCPCCSKLAPSPGPCRAVSPLRSWANLFNADALIKFVPTVASCLAMVATLEHFSHPLALPTGALAFSGWGFSGARAGVAQAPGPSALRCLPPSAPRSLPTSWLLNSLPQPAVLAAINILFHLVRLAMGVTLAQAMDAQWIIRPAVSERGRGPA